MTRSAESCLDVRWIEPKLIRGVAHYEHRCEAQLMTPESREFRQRLGRDTACLNFAKIDFRGIKLCVKHAEKRALIVLMNGEEQ